MSFIQGSSSGHINLSNDILAAVLATSADSWDTIAVAGTGYAVGDEITLTGGTFTTATVIEVTEISGGGGTGPIVAARIVNAGIYSVAPSDPVAQGSTTGAGINATHNMTYSGNGWTQDRDTGDSISAVDSVAAGGTGYSVNDIITLSGGTYSTQAQLKVLTLSGSAVATVSIETAGVYSAIPADAVAQDSVAPTGGSGATFNLTWEAGERQVIIHGSGAGGDSIYVGWRTYTEAGSSRYNWELHGMTGYDADQSIVAQPAVNPGDNENAVNALKHGAYVPLNNLSLTWWMSVTPSRIIVVVRAGGSYFPFYLGFINRFATSAEYPYPLLVAGPTDSRDGTSTQSEKMSTLTNPWSTGSIVAGPMHLLDSSGTWVRFANATVSASDINPASVVNSTSPCGVLSDSSAAPENDRFTTFNFAYSFDKIVNQNNLNAADANLEPTPGTEDVYVMFPTTMVHSNTASDQQVYGEVDDVFWFSAFGGVANENRLIQDGIAYRVFQNCNNVAAHHFFAIKEN